MEIMQSGRNNHSRCQSDKSETAKIFFFSLFQNRNNGRNEELSDFPRPDRWNGKKTGPV